MLGTIIYRQCKMKKAHFGYLDYLKSLFTKQQFGAHIYTLGVISEMRGSGLAKQLFEHFRDEVCKQQQYKVIYLDCIEYNHSAIRFYEKMRFVKTKMKISYYNIYKRQYNSFEFMLYINEYNHYNKWLMGKGMVVEPAGF